MAAQKLIFCIFPPDVFTFFALLSHLPIPISPERHKTKTISALQMGNQAKAETGHLFKFQV